MNKRIALPLPVARIYEAVAELDEIYRDKGRKFTPDGHMVGSLGEVIAAEAFRLKLHAASHPGHDAIDENGREVQIKMTGQNGKKIALYATCNRLIVLKIVSPAEAEVVYDGPGDPVWSEARKRGKNGQCVVSLARIRDIAANQISN